ncbi:site-specific integrase [Candidatus Atribacteria bacterium 1244-E10-H5-B2]|nr:MAG: site-specific integrase [Candidatus Atribacteria bacterium 1244-E10-H5-B2]
MNFVEPIRDRKQIDKIKGNLYRQKNPRDFLLFVLSVNTGLRISDILSLQVEDIKDRKGNLKDSLYILEQKTKKRRTIPLNKQAQEALSYYLKKTGIYDLDRYLFINEKSGDNKPLTRVRAWQLINKWCREVGLDCKVGGHTLRKTFGYHLRKQGVSIERISDLLGHRNIKVTFRYIGISDDERKEVLSKFGL